MNFHTPFEVIDLSIIQAEKKVNQHIIKMILLGFLAGAFIAFGSEASSLAVHNIKDIGIARLIAGLIFPVGLIMVVILGAELFTGNWLITMAVLDNKVRWKRFLLNLLVVYFSNMLGALFVAAMVYKSGQLNFTDGTLGAFTIFVAYNKTSIPFNQLFISGILCNVLVCGAILMAGCSKDVTGKCLAIFFPIWTFVTSGFEHCVANMYYLPAGYFASKNPQYLQKASELYGISISDLQESLTISNFTLGNLLPVSLGNIVGGMFFIALVFYFVHKSDRLVDKTSETE